jgi:hypothetical protein
MTDIRQGQFGAWLGSLAAPLLLFGIAPAQAQTPTSVPPPSLVATYADMADLAEAAAIVALVEVRRQTLVPPARAPGLAPGHARLYIEARTEALLAGRSALGEALVYLADVPLMPNGKPPKLRRERFLVFADPVLGRPGSLQLVAPGAQLPATPEIERLARTVLTELAAPDVPPRLTGVRDVMSVAGNLAGESETQLFLGTATGAPVSLTVIRRPGMAPEWGVSWSEIVDQAARPPAPESIEWYRLACFLPQGLPAEAFLQSDQASRRQAEADYRFILDQLGECRRLHA